MAQRVPHVPYADYLALEAKGDGKHEYVGGVIYAMAGGTPEHARLQANMTAALLAGLRGRPCAVFSSDLRVRIDATDRSTYPDVTVVCGAIETSSLDKDAVTNPTLLVEVTSESTEADDRGDKFAHYRQLASLQEYVIVGSRTPHIEVWRRNERGRWELADEGGPGAKLQLGSIDVGLDVAGVYANPLAASG
ncbi:MAG: Uma2 family endonuclease [Polyangiaceae bacterium]|jgi:Uma2 family endonuclease